MPRLMSVALTEDAVRDRAKTVTRRLGWTYLKPGDRLQLVRKAMGRKRIDGSVEPLVHIALVEVVDVRREPLWTITRHDVLLEGLFQRAMVEVGANEMDVALWFVDFFCATHKGCTPDTEVTRIEWRYLDDEAVTA